MLLTEEQARKKRCPNGVGNISTVAQIGDEARLRVYGSNCIGDGCMAWRWQKDIDFLEVDEQPRGYCGAFGPPPQVLP